MSVPAEVERKVRQLDNDVQAIYDLLEGISETLQRHGNQMDLLDRHLNSIGGVQMRHGVRLDDLDRRMADLDTKLTGVVSTQQRQGNRLDSLDGKLDAILSLLRNGRSGGEGE